MGTRMKVKNVYHVYFKIQYKNTLRKPVLNKILVVADNKTMAKRKFNRGKNAFLNIKAIDKISITKINLFASAI